MKSEKALPRPFHSVIAVSFSSSLLLLASFTNPSEQPAFALTENRKS